MGNLTDKKGLKTKDKESVLTKDPMFLGSPVKYQDGKVTQDKKFVPGAFILSRLIGHLELEPVNRPMFNPD